MKIASSRAAHNSRPAKPTEQTRSDAAPPDEGIPILALENSTPMPAPPKVLEVVAWRLLTTKQAAGYLGVGERFIQTETGAGRLPFIRLGDPRARRRPIRYSLKDLREYAEAGRVSPGKR